MTAHDAPNTGDLPHPAVDSHNDPGTTGSQDTTDAATNIKYEEVVAVIPQSGTENDGDDDAGYLIYTLSESEDPAAPTSEPSATGSESGTHYRLRAVPYSPSKHPQQRHLTAALSPFMLNNNKTSLPPHLAPGNRRRVHVLVFKGSGLRSAPEFWSSVLRPLLNVVGVVPDEVAELDGAQAVREAMRRLAREAERSGGEKEVTVVLLSGDGGVVELLSALDRGEEEGAGRVPTVALFPLGTGNALFHSLHKPLYEGNGASPLVLALRSLLFGTSAPLPTFRVSFSPGARLAAAPGDDRDGGDPPKEEHPVTHLIGAVVASYGFHASLVWASDTPEYRVHGDKRFGMAAAELLKKAHAYDAEVQVRWKGGEGFVPLRIPTLHDGKKEETSPQRLTYLLLTLVSNLEQAFTISPASRPLDGVLRGVWFGAVGGVRTMEIMTKAYQGGAHVGMPDVGYTGDESPELEEVRVVAYRNWQRAVRVAKSKKPMSKARREKYADDAAKAKRSTTTITTTTNDGIEGVMPVGENPNFGELVEGIQRLVAQLFWQRRRRTAP
ncbi:hypothetical protein VTJ49DRAFT_2871 [Mycothermus thermophilus]|uniref:DAGKc domain-containing protein n=1 Tax=Humicola insolens TaxID=85995 RepID=A0ABR3V957_HUMIN